MFLLPVNSCDCNLLIPGKPAEKETRHVLVW